MKNPLKSGQATFNIEVPYKLIETGDSSEEKPVIIYLHGFNQNMEQFEKLVAPMFDLEAHHLFVQGPYPIYDRSRKKKVEDWGRSWYLYDGEQDQFVKSLESASDFLENLMEDILQQVTVSRLAIFGYSMGGYLAGYFALSRPELVDELIVIGARIKTEVFKDEKVSYDDMNVLALHGTGDKSVKSEPQQKSCKELSEWGANVMFKEMDGSHKLDGKYLRETQKWLASLDY
ncbi:alpha/beta hydrolase [Fodinibius sp. AD559]|uniref:alpha/beta hydrolase n=1 Tax=Fodinibius sp. AD559 TaxID=3424179 RepID=UPI004046E2B8